MIFFFSNFSVFAGHNCRLEFLTILGWRKEIRLVDHGYGSFRTAGGAHGTTETAIEIHDRNIIFSHGKRFRWTPVDTGFTGHAQIRVEKGVKT